MKTDKDIEKIIALMTLEEKAGLCSGADMWHTKGVPRLGIPSVMMADGPHGLRKQAEDDELGLHKSVPATCFPTASALASSWDRELLKRTGAAIAEECRAQGVSILLGPGCNIKRSPLCGRNFEYYSEDPRLASELAVAFIEGVQSRGVGTSLKHFAANNQETRRMNIDAVVDERTLREIYLASFEGVVKKAAPVTVMCAYNRVNGWLCSENRRLLTDILRKEWGYEGCVLSDWGAVADRAKGLAAGLDVEMPASGGERDQRIAEAVKKGELPEDILNETVRRILRMVFDCLERQKTESKCDMDEHRRLAGTAAMESMVLLKNENILPLKKGGKLAVIGGFAKRPRYQGGGSSHVNPAFLDNAWDEIVKTIQGTDTIVEYAQGYRMDGESGPVIEHELVSLSDRVDEELIAEACRAAQGADTAIVFAGLPESYETEGADRTHLRMPEGHCALIKRVAGVQKNVAVVLSNGAPVEMPWLDHAGAVLEGYLGGQCSGSAVAAILFGEANPCGKLAETFPKKLADTPAYLNFPGERDRVEYREGLFVGYRYYDAKELEPLFPFGYGLSYTAFAYTRMWVDKEELLDTDQLTVAVSVRNTGNVSGKEIVQLYIRPERPEVTRPPKELKDFQKVALRPGEEKDAVFILNRRAFAYYEPKTGEWVVQDGKYEILAGRSSKDIALRQKITVIPVAKEEIIFTEDSTANDILEFPERAERLDDLFVQLNFMGLKRLCDLPVLFRDMPLRSLLVFMPGGFKYSLLDEILRILNGGNG